MKHYTVAVVGATGAVGRTMISTLEKRGFPVSSLKALASERTAGETIVFNGQPVKVEVLTEKSFDGVDIALFSAGGSVSERYVPYAVKAGAVVIDNTSHFRMDENVPLVVPEVNPEDLYAHQGIIANPNCSTIQMVHALNAIRTTYGIRKLVVSTYQAVSGTGKDAVDELREQVLNEASTPSIYPHPIAYNVLPQIDVFMDNGYTKEEMKMIHETKKIWHDPSIAVTATCVRVPVVSGHAESIYLETNTPYTLEEVHRLLTQTPGVIVQDDPGTQTYPMPLTSAGNEHTFVGRVRPDLHEKNGLNLWVVADNLLKGAALNSIQIAETLIEKDII